jgi:outer membrane protein
MNTFALVALASVALRAIAADPQVTAGPPPVDVSIEEGLQLVLDDALAANLELRAGSATVQQRIAALDKARARYLPVLDFAARYSVADGGRTIDFPVGDLLNPVYETLDEMLVADGLPPRFPRVKNEQIALLRDQEQETKFVLSQPLYEPRIGPAVEANRQELNRVEYNMSALRNRVVRDTKTAYYRWIATQQAVLILDASLELAQVNLDANESLYRNGRITRDFVYRAEADVLEIEQRRMAAESQVRIAQSYVNLLRNVPLHAALPRAAIDGNAVDRFRDRLIQGLAGRSLSTPELQRLATQRRDELRGLDAAVAAGQAQQELARAAYKPRLLLGAEAGIQGEEYGFEGDDRYVLASVILRWNAYRGGADRAALAEARALTEERRAARDLVTQQVQQEVLQSLEGLHVADASLATASKRVKAADGAFRITSRKRDLGQVNQTEFIDARRSLTEAQLNLTRVRTEFLAKLAELEFAIGDASYPD